MTLRVEHQTGRAHTPARHRNCRGLTRHWWTGAEWHAAGYQPDACLPRLLPQKPLQQGLLIALHYAAVTPYIGVETGLKAIAAQRDRAILAAGVDGEDQQVATLEEVENAAD